MKIKMGIFAFLLLWLLMPAALAEENATDAGALNSMLAAHPGYTAAAQTQRGDTAAAVLTRDGQNTLLVAERENGAWAITIDNPTALWQGEQLPAITLDSETLFWQYANSYDESKLDLYSARKENGAWGNVEYLYLDNASTPDDPYLGFSVTYQDYGWDQVLIRKYRYQDGAEVYERALIPMPASWLSGYVSLATYNNEKCPSKWANASDGACEAYRQGIAKQLMPQYIYHGGAVEPDTLEFLMERPDGALVFVGVSFNEAEGWMLTESTPLPAGTQFGHDNFTTCLYFAQEGYEMLVQPKRFWDGSWGIDYLYATPTDGTPDEMIMFGRNWVADSAYTPTARYYGDHPWTDITDMDWTSLPLHLSEALTRVDNTRWAVVNNPDRMDRLCLRSSPAKDAASLGEYYNGAAVRVLAEAGEWVKVSVCGAEGYMPRACLAFGEAMIDVISVGPILKSRALNTPVYESPQSEHPFASLLAGDIPMDLRILGVVGDEWYHVFAIYSEISGYVKQGAFELIND